ncbi:glycosyltransferase family 2 protein [Acrocarpospora catenulata]|uniref:glycosyltransferase family 2 protein n=1 Tax=Acrocarpospora catenulata TaxID=2836182 RepID=UPI001BDA5E95|nr:glycosyltransferase [Acrocarpospora catenulata]
MDRSAPLVSVVVSARGNGSAVRSLLQSLTMQTLTDFDVIIVDNDARRDRTISSLVAAGNWPFAVRALREARAGVSRGRNRGMRAARGHYIAITDPDITPRPTWLQALVSAAIEEKAAIVGGRVITSYPDGMAIAMDGPTSRPLAECHGPVDWPPGRTGYGWPYWIVTANLLIDRQVLPGLGLLRADLGRRGRLPLDCEDLEFADRAVQAGLRVVIEPGAVVDHPVGYARTRLGWFLAQGIGHGVCVARMHTSVAVPAPALRADRADMLDALAALVGAWGFWDRALLAVGLRDLARIAAYHLERRRLACMGHTLLPPA